MNRWTKLIGMLFVATPLLAGGTFKVNRLSQSELVKIRRNMHAARMDNGGLIEEAPFSRGARIFMQAFEAYLAEIEADPSLMPEESMPPKALLKQIKEGLPWLRALTGKRLPIELLDPREQRDSYVHPDKTTILTKREKKENEMYSLNGDKPVDARVVLMTSSKGEERFVIQLLKRKWESVLSKELTAPVVRAIGHECINLAYFSGLIPFNDFGRSFTGLIPQPFIKEALESELTIQRPVEETAVAGVASDFPVVADDGVTRGTRLIDQLKGESLVALLRTVDYVNYTPPDPELEELEEAEAGIDDGTLPGSWPLRRSIVGAPIELRPGQDFQIDIRHHVLDGVERLAGSFHADTEEPGFRPLSWIRFSSASSSIVTGRAPREKGSYLFVFTCNDSSMSGFPKDLGSKVQYSVAVLVDGAGTLPGPGKVRVISDAERKRRDQRWRALEQKQPKPPIPPTGRLRSSSRYQKQTLPPDAFLPTQLRNGNSSDCRECVSP